MKFYAIFIFILGIPMVFFVDTTIEFQICLIHAMNRRKAVHICVRRRFFLSAKSIISAKTVRISDETPDYDLWQLLLTNKKKPY